MSIGALSRATRIPVETLRTWEQRYGFPMPVRRPSGHRVYESSAVEHLRRIRRLLSHGHRPADIVRLSVRELDRLLALSEPPDAPKPRVPQREVVDGIWIAQGLERLMQATLGLDRRQLTQELQTCWMRLGPLRFLEELAGPFMVRLGEAWSEKKLQVQQEHFASACLLDFLRSVRQPFDEQARGPRVVAATLPGEKHEGGLVMTSVVLAVRGYRVLYLGLDAPVEQIAEAVRIGDAEAVAVSVSAAMPRARAAHDVAELRKALPSRVSLWVGGAGAPLATRGTERFASLTALDERLREPA